MMTSGIFGRRPTQDQLKHRPRNVRFLLTLTFGGCLTGVHFWMSILEFTKQNERKVQIVTDGEIISTAAFPPQCSTSDLKTITYQLPDGDCSETSKRPWVNACSFSYATRCPDAVWLTDQYKSTTGSSRASTSPVLVIYVGCNKAMDAIDSLRMITGDATYDRDQWRDSLFEGQEFEAGRCGQDTRDQFQIVDNKKRNAVVHCIEAMPVTAARLSQTAHALGWQNQLIVSNVAMSDTDGSILFPNVDGKVGVENMGIDNCQGKDAEQHCKTVQLYRLDTFTDLHLPNKYSLVDFLSIDVEGFDYEVLLGAPQLLKRTKYIEFEYNWKGKWKNHKLSTAVGMLKDAGFVCYWAGTFGHIWRITDCWLDFYDLKFWSNVACANVRVPEAAPLAARMEELFQQTLGTGQRIQYSNKNTANTDGGFPAS